MSLSPAEVEVIIHGSALGAHPGQECVGRVERAGESAAHLAGRGVLIPRLIACGECEACRRGRLTVCSARTERPRRPVEREVLPARFLLPLEPPFVASALEPAALWPYAAVADGLLAPYSGLVRAGVTPGTLCVVLGGGVRAALCAVVIRALGGVAVACAPRADEREELLAPPYHAHAALDPIALDPDAARARVREIAAAAGLPVHGAVLIETTGSDAGRARALGMSEAGGTVILLSRGHALEDGAPPAGALAAEQVGGSGLTSVALLERVTEEQCQILGAGAPHPDLLPELLALLDRARVDLSTLVQPVDAGSIESVMAERRAGRAASLALPVVRFA